jgi:hypothetical protein
MLFSDSSDKGKDTNKSNNDRDQSGCIDADGEPPRVAIVGSSKHVDLKPFDTH